jgi:hypothetical protein
VYVEQAKSMAEFLQSTMYVDFLHLVNTDGHLAAAVSSEFYRFEPYLRMAIQRFMLEKEPAFAQRETEAREFFVSFFNLPVRYKSVTLCGWRRRKRRRRGGYWIGCQGELGDGACSPLHAPSTLAVLSRCCACPVGCRCSRLLCHR